MDSHAFWLGRTRRCQVVECLDCRKITSSLSQRFACLHAHTSLQKASNINKFQGTAHTIHPMKFQWSESFFPWQTIAVRFFQGFILSSSQASHCSRKLDQKILAHLTSPIPLGVSQIIYFQSCVWYIWNIRQSAGHWTRCNDSGHLCYPWSEELWFTLSFCENNIPCNERISKYTINEPTKCWARSNELVLAMKHTTLCMLTLGV